MNRMLCCLRRTDRRTTGPRHGSRSNRDRSFRRLLQRRPLLLLRQRRSHNHFLHQSLSWDSQPALPRLCCWRPEVSWHGISTRIEALLPRLSHRLSCNRPRPPYRPLSHRQRLRRGRRPSPRRAFSSRQLQFRRSLSPNRGWRHHPTFLRRIHHRPWSNPRLQKIRRPQSHRRHPYPRPYLERLVQGPCTIRARPCLISAWLFSTTFPRRG